MLLDGDLELNVALFELYEKKNKKKTKNNGLLFKPSCALNINC